MKTISILGCGWLGIPLAEALIQKGFSIKGSTTSANKLSVLQNKGIEPFAISLEADGAEGDIQKFLDGSDLLIIDIPPRFHFSQKIKALIPFIENSGLKNVLLVSSTAVYEDDNSIITEQKIPDPKTEKSTQLFDAENILRHNPNFDTTVLRFGGLIGGNRHPVRYLAGQTDLENPGAPVNLIHIQDCIGVICRIIETQTWGETFNAASPYHPARETYYTQKAAEFDLIAPKFNHSSASVGKTIDPEKLQRILQYEFQFRDL
jgi:nucleoside-diphosphate-sugar epimerase